MLGAVSLILLAHLILLSRELHFCLVVFFNDDRGHPELGLVGVVGLLGLVDHVVLRLNHWI